MRKLLSWYFPHEYLGKNCFESGAEHEGKNKRSKREASSSQEQGKGSEAQALHRAVHSTSAHIGTDQAEDEHAGPDDPPRESGQGCPEPGKVKTKNKQKQIVQRRSRKVSTISVLLK